MRSYASGTSDVPLLGETIGENLDRIASAFPNADALVDIPSGGRWTYTELNAEVNALAAALLDLGLCPGDRVGIWAPSSPEWFMLQYATARVGVILVPINPAYRRHELEFVLNHAGIRMVVSAPRFKTSDYAAMLSEALPNTPTVEKVVYLDSPEWDDLLERGRAAHSTDPSSVADIQSALSMDDPINIQYTSGTTGFPKGATLSHHAVLNDGFFIGELLGYTEMDRVCIPVPFYHCFGMVIGNLAATSHGTAVVIPARSFEPAATLNAIQAERCTSLLGVPTMFIAQLAHPDFGSYDLNSLRTGSMGGAPCPVEVMKKIIDRMGITEISVCYGMTETAPISMLSRRHDSLDKRVNTVGRVMPHLEVKIIDPETGRTLPRGFAGEFCTRGYSVMAGYWNDPERTAEAIDEHGWMHSGDIGLMDDEGYVAITGRIKDMVIRGGENLYPREIEEFLYTHPDVVDAQVVGVPDAKLGEELMAWVKLREGAEPMTAETLRAYCKGKLAHFKVPRYVHVVDEFPMTVTGKIRKVDMREISAKLIAGRTA
ncbi:AMP-binding protein [Arthrobacter sp. NPDC080031]|uniref:AMP-binding protein n=1 Tax=Arthrobacter sp. NPDC080031 TaxID=3155918 RepID=UPI00344C8FEC